MKLHFYKSKTFIARLIKYFSKGEFSHVAIEINGNTYQALGGRIFGTNGVVMSPYKASYHRGSNKAEITTVDASFLCEDWDILHPVNKELVAYLNERVGLKYDVKGVLSFIFRFVRGKEHSFYCSELAIRSIEIWTGKKYDLKYSPTAIFELVK